MKQNSANMLTLELFRYATVLGPTAAIRELNVIYDIQKHRVVKPKYFKDIIFKEDYFLKAQKFLVINWRFSVVD